MSKHDFSLEEFGQRRARVRRAIAAAGLDWLVIFHPVGIHWLTGSDAKSYQEFQCLLISAKPGPLAVLTREGERNEFQDDAWVDAIHTFGGGENEEEGRMRVLGFAEAQALQRIIRSSELPASTADAEAPAPRISEGARMVDGARIVPARMARPCHEASRNALALFSPLPAIVPWTAVESPLCQSD
jgi:Xaa-Pro dipeptidase